MAKSETTNGAGEKPVYLDKRDEILPLGSLCHTVRFSQFLLPGSLANDTGNMPGDHYAIVQPHYLTLTPKKQHLDKNVKVKNDAVEDALQRIARHMPITSDLRDKKLPDPNKKGDVREMRRALAKQAPILCGVELNDEDVCKHYQEAIQRAQRQEIKRILAPLRRFGIVSGQVNSIDDLRHVIEETLFPSQFQPIKSFFPHFTFCLVFEEEWFHKGYTRGECINSIGLAPGEELTLEVHSWTKEHFKSERELAVEAEMTLSNRLTARDHLEVAGKIATQTNYGINANVNVTIPVEGIPIGIGTGANLGVALNSAIEATAQRIMESTNEAANALKSQRKLRIEESRETGREEKQLRKVVNTNRCHTLNIHYFEALSNFEVTLKLVDVAPCVLLPMPRYIVTSAWVLCHEHILKAVLLDKIFLSGFKAAKTLETKAALERIEEASPSRALPPETPTAPANPYEEEMKRHRQSILSAFKLLLKNENDAKDNIDSLGDCGINLFCIGSEIAALADRMPKLIYLGLLRLNSSAFNALKLLEEDMPALEAIRNFFASVTPRDYQYNIIASTLAKALDQIGIPEAIVDIIIGFNLIDFVADDCGLYVAVKAAYARLRGLEAPLRSADFDQQAATTFEEDATTPLFAEPEAPISRLEIAEAEVEFNRLKCHIEENRKRYFYAVWSRTSAGLRRNALFPQLERLLQRTPIGFVENKAAYPITNRKMFERWFNFNEIGNIKKKWAALSSESLKVSLPTTGLIAESTVGKCCACEDYIVESRLIDLRHRSAIATKEEMEARRREKRIDAGQLEPFDPCCAEERERKIEETQDSTESKKGGDND